jgi:hypothetical protein
MQQLLGWFSAFLAEAYLLTARPVEARELAGEALAVTEAVGFQYGVGLAQRALGRIHRAAGELTEGGVRLRESLESFRSIQAAFEEGRTHLDLALLAHDGGDDVESARHLGEAYRRFKELRVPKYVERAERLAGELAVPLAPPPLQAASAVPGRSNGPNAR